MSEPKVEFELNKIEDEDIRLQFDQFREWYEFREDRGTPAIQTFEGSLESNQEVKLYVSGKVYGAVGMTQRYLATTGYYWVPIDGTLTGRVNFSLDNTDSSDNYVRLKNNNAGRTLDYTLTVFYRGQ